MNTPTHCPHCLTRPANLDHHLRYFCQVLRPEAIKPIIRR